MIMLAFTVIKFLGNILAVYIGCKAVIPFLFSGTLYSLIGLMMRINSGSNQECHLKVNVCVGALVTSCYLKLYNVRAGDSEYWSDGQSIIQCVGDEFVRRGDRASTRLKNNGDSGRQFKVKTRYKKGSLYVFSDCLFRLIC